MIKTIEMYRKVCEETDRLEKLIKNGKATDVDRQRFIDGMDYELIWEWGHQHTAAAEVLPPLPRDRRALRFVEWWERNQYQIDLDVTYWPDAFTWWVKPLELSAADELALHLEVSQEINERRWLQAHPEPAGMVVTDLERIPDGDGESEAA